jgi:arylsulfatase A-like enzyme
VRFCSSQSNLAGLLLLLLLGGAAACNSDADAPLPVDTVVLVSIDSLRADHLGSYGYPYPTSPTIDRLAATGWAFDRAYSTTSWTLPSHVSLLTGLDNARHRVSAPDRRLAESVDTLAEALTADGVETVGFFSGPFLHPSFGLGQGFARYVDSTSYAGERGTALLTEDERDLLAKTAPGPDANVELGAAALLSHRDTTNPILLENLKAWLGSRAQSERTFVFIHMWDVHFDYIPPERYVKLFDPDYAGPLHEKFFDALGPDTPPRDLRHVIARYDAEIRFTDDTLGQMLAALREHGLLERAAILVTADHGEEFFDHGGKGHGGTLHEEVLRVPLVMNLTTAVTTGARSDEVVSLIDVFPTVCELLDAACETPAPGASLIPRLLGASDAPARNDALAELAVMAVRMAALVRPDDKVVRVESKNVTRYYDRAALRDEAPPEVVGADAAENGERRAALRQFEQRVGDARREGRSVESLPLAPGDWNSETNEQLRALGYIE